MLLAYCLVICAHSVALPHRYSHLLLYCDHGSRWHFFAGGNKNARDLQASEQGHVPQLGNTTKAMSMNVAKTGLTQLACRIDANSRFYRAHSSALHAALWNAYAFVLCPIAEHMVAAPTHTLQRA